MSIEDRAIDSSRQQTADHARQYLESDGANVDHPAAGHLILLYTTGRTSGEIRRTPLRFFDDGDDLVVTASFRGSPKHPDWYLNILDDPNVWIRHNADLYEATASTLEPEARDEMWAYIVSKAPHFAEYQEATDRIIPVVRFTRMG